MGHRRRHDNWEWLPVVACVVIMLECLGSIILVSALALGQRGEKFVTIVRLLFSFSQENMVQQSAK